MADAPTSNNLQHVIEEDEERNRDGILASVDPDVALSVAEPAIDAIDGALEAEGTLLEGAVEVAGSVAGSIIEGIFD